MIYALLGPTASKKSELAEKMSLMLGGAPIVNYDVFQMYKEMDIGTAKPDVKLLNSGRYYLYDFQDVEEPLTVYDYQSKVRILLNSLLKTNKNIIFVGGNGLYLKASLFDYHFLKEDPMPKDYLEGLSDEELFIKLQSIDLKDALRIGEHNRKRLLRALYIYEQHSQNKDQINKNGKDALLYENVSFIGINPPREELYRAINDRVERMFALGLKDEVHSLMDKYDFAKIRAFQAIGYKEFLLDVDVEAIKEEIKKHTRNYAKRQLTFFKNQFKDVERFSDADSLLSYLNKLKR
jgi:tRNA dimethylallyltransferase